MADAGGSFRSDLEAHIRVVDARLAEANAAREAALPACRRVIQLAGSAIKAAHRLEWDRAEALGVEAESEVRAAQAQLSPHPALVHAGFLHDAEKEFVEARMVVALIQGRPLPSPGELSVGGPAYLKGLAEAASELRRHLLDRLRAGELDQAERLLQRMDEVYDALVLIDYPDAVTQGLRRTLDAVRAVLERSRGDLTLTVIQTRLQRRIEEAAGGGSADERSG